jgi:defect-in-organelle-trafficking protein DotB
LKDLDMLDVVTAGPSGAPAAPDRTWPDDGRAWVVEPRRDAPGLDSFMAWAHRRGASEIRFQTWNQPQFQLHQENTWIDREPLDDIEIAKIVNHIYGADGMARLQGGKHFNVMYVIGIERGKTLRFRVNATASMSTRGNGADLSIRTVKDMPPPRESQNVEPEIMASFMERGGLTIVAGETNSGKSTLIGGMTVAKLLDPNGHRKIIEGAAPIEFLLDRVKSPNSMIAQSDIPVNLETFNDFLDGAMRRNPSDIIVGECSTWETMEAAIKAATSGHGITTTTHADSVAGILSRIVDLCPLALKTSMPKMAAQAAHLFIFQRLVKARMGGLTPIREFLVFDQDIRNRLVDHPIDAWPKLMRDAVEQRGQSFRRGIQNALNETRITEETAAGMLRGLR